MTDLTYHRYGGLNRSKASEDCHGTFLFERDTRLQRLDWSMTI